MLFSAFFFVWTLGLNQLEACVTVLVIAKINNANITSFSWVHIDSDFCLYSIDGKLCKLNFILFSQSYG